MQATLGQTIRDSLSTAEYRAQLAFRAGVHWIVSGSFKSAALYLLAFDPVQRTLNVASTIDAYGPHQYLATNAARDRLYATTWASPPILSSWAVELQTSDNDDRSSSPSSDPAVIQAAPKLAHLNNADIFATSSYISVTNTTIHSAGGPTAELHGIRSDGGFGEKIQQLQYVSDAEMATTDRTRKALRVGSHGFDLTPDGYAFVPHLGRNSIYMYEQDKLTLQGKLHLLDEVVSPRQKDGPRHVWPSRNGKLLYSITEHTNYVDVYEIRSNTLKHIQSGSVVPSNVDRHDYRGNTLRLSRDGKFLFASTRGSTPSTKGYVTAFALDADGKLANDGVAVSHYETKTSCGIAGAIEPAFWKGSEGIAGQDYLIHVDEEAGYVNILGWSGALRKFSEIASTQLPEGASASHALWLS